MNIVEIYKKYQIMPQLQEHQLTVAGVAKTILENLVPPQPSAKGGHLLLFESEPQSRRPQGEGISKDIITACLLHDMGNIIKFDLSKTDKLLPGRFTKEDIEFWRKVKEGYIVKYGNDEHHATIKIAKELGVSKRGIELIDCIGFRNGKNNAESENFGKKVCAYSDMRVGPKGIISLEGRLLDLRGRYEHKHILMGGNESLRVEFENGLRHIEKQIFEHSNIRPEDITEDNIKQRLGELKQYEI